MDMYSNFYPQAVHMNPVPIQAGYPATNGYGVPTRVPPPPNSNQRRMDNRQNFQSDQNSSKTLWMGNIDVSMDENLIQEAFNMLGVNVHNIKIIRNKDNGLPLGYGFVSFDDRSTAQDALRELNGKKMPNVEEDKRFFLKRANRSGRFSVFVGNLPPQIDNEVLLNAFMTYYPSVSSAKGNCFGNFSIFLS
ncbi:tRNA selenocysteine 1-associated protein 1-like protein [Euroglyphus maynei]|uniref:tRNA selenocysteine 1-associated protein 1-like protein n=1 Tax=Euroglyphus maynei TaxID=6958 RepID=A0A1Y3B3P1_EURMA|nr:tRNA selenocysteine 1-associated protein 1-like protein [Euroglyphus maynei]